MRMTVALLACVLSWNVVFGVLGGALLCLHADFSAHVELESAIGANCHDEASGAEHIDACPPCVDFALGAERFESVRTEGRAVLPAPLLTASPDGWGLEINLAAAAIPSAEPVRLRAPPAHRSQSLIVAETHVRLV